MDKDKKEEIASGDIAQPTLPIELKKKKEKKMNEEVMEDNIYHEKSGILSDTMVLPNGDYAYLDSLNNILITHQEGYSLEFICLETGEEFIVNDQDCWGLLYNREDVCVDDNNIKCYNDWKIYKSEKELFDEKYNELFPMKELSPLTDKDYELLKCFADRRCFYHIILDKNEILQYDFTKKAIHGHHDANTIVDYKNNKITVKDKDYSIKEFEEKFLANDLTSLFNIVKDNFVKDEA